MRVTRIKISSNRSFGLVFFVVFLLVSLWPLTDEGLLTEKIKVVPLFISVVFLILGLLNSKLLTPLNKLWFKFGITLGNIVAPIVMGIIYFLLVTPTGLIMKIIGKDLLNKKYDKNKKTYWILRDKKITLMKKQF